MDEAKNNSEEKVKSILDVVAGDSFLDAKTTLEKALNDLVLRAFIKSS